MQIQNLFLIVFFLKSCTKIQKLHKIKAEQAHLNFRKASRINFSMFGRQSLKTVGVNVGYQKVVRSI